MSKKTNQLPEIDPSKIPPMPEVKPIKVKWLVALDNAEDRHTIRDILLKNNISILEEKPLMKTGLRITVKATEEIDVKEILSYSIKSSINYTTSKIENKFIQ